MKTLSRSQLRNLINEELIKTDEPTSEISQLTTSKAGRQIVKEGKRIMSAGKAINECAYGQTGAMRSGLANISEFVYKVGKALSSIDSLKEGESVASKLPSIQELKQLHKEIQRLEKL
jgi:hypothetical protein